MDKWEADARQLILNLTALKGRAAELKLWRTVHLLDDALNHAGWELARMLEAERTK